MSDTRRKLKSVLDDILNFVEDIDNAPSVGGDDTVTDLETDVNLIQLALTQLHNRVGVRSAKRRNYKYGKYRVKTISGEEVQQQNRGGYGHDEWPRIFEIICGERYVETPVTSNTTDDDWGTVAN